MIRETPIKWTEADEEVLTNMYNNNKSFPYMSSRMGRTVYAISNKIAKLGLRRAKQIKPKLVSRMKSSGRPPLSNADFERRVTIFLERRSCGKAL